LLTKFPTREFVLSERSESKDLSSHATTEGSDLVGKHVYLEQPKGVEGSLLFDAKGPEPAWAGEVESKARSCVPAGSTKIPSPGESPLTAPIPLSSRSTLCNCCLRRISP
jgi:hypothetical protein